MVDSTTPFDGSTSQPDPATPPPESGPAKGGIQGFLNSTPGKIVLGALAGLVLLGVLGYLAFTFLLNKNQETAPTSSTTVVTSSTAPPSKAATAVATEAPAIPIGEVFTFRDIWLPTIDADDLATETAAGSTSSSTSTTVSTAKNTLTLTAVTVENGEDVAVLVWNGTEYRLAEGESIPDTPWKVLSINGNTVVMLFGDQRVTLVVGEGISK